MNSVANFIEYRVGAMTLREVMQEGLKKIRVRRVGSVEERLDRVCFAWSCERARVRLSRILGKSIFIYLYNKFFCQYKEEYLDLLKSVTRVARVFSCIEFCVDCDRCISTNIRRRVICYNKLYVYTYNRIFQKYKYRQV